MFLSSLTLCNTILFFTQLVQLIFSILLQYHISELSRYLWSTFWRVHVSVPYTIVSQMLNFNGASSLNLIPVYWLKQSSCLMLCLPWQSGIYFMCTSCIICYCATEIVEIFHILLLFLISHNLYWGWLNWDSHYLSGNKYRDKYTPALQFGV